MKYFLAPIVFLFSISNISAQLASHLKINPEDIATAEKLQKKYPKEGYISLSTSETYSFNYSSKTKKVEAEVDFKETIMGLKENKKFQNVIWLNNESNVSNMYGRDYKNKIKYISSEKSSYASAGIFYDDAKIFTYSFNIVTRGDITKYHYNENYNDIKYLTKTFFHSSFPVEEKKIIFEIPQWLTLEFVEVNFKNFNITKTEVLDTKRNLNIITYTFKDIKPINSSNYSASWSSSLPHLLILSKKYKYKENSYNLFSNTNDLYAWYSSLIKEVDNNPEDLKLLVTEIIADAKTDDEKVEKIFYWVQDNIRYIAFENGIMGFKPDNANNVCKKKYGDCKGMANLTCEMLKIAGYDARLTWIGTRSIPYSYSTPSLAVDNHMITTLFLNGNKYYLDATETGVAYKDYAHRIQGQDVLIEDNESFILDKVPEFDPIHNKETITLNFIIDNDNLKGNGENTYNGEEKNILFRNIGSVAKIDLNQRVSAYIANHDKNNNVTNLVISNASNRNLPIHFKYDIEVANHITTVANEMYINLEFDFDFEDTKVKEDRIIDMDFGQKVYKDETITLKVPENSKVDYLPESIFIDNGEFIFNLKYSFDEGRKLITYTKKIILKTGTISNANFEAWNSIIKKLKPFYNEQIVIIKN